MALPDRPAGRLPAGLCVFGLTYACGITWGGSPKANPTPLSARQVIDLAAGSGLSWVEMPPAMLGDSSEELDALRTYGEGREIRFIVAGSRVGLEGLRRGIAVASQLGAPVLRCTLSGVLCGDRRGFPGGWPAHLRKCTAVIEEVLPEAERSGVAIAVENHQDADSADLLALCSRFESAHFGITLDCGNPLAVMEEPVAFAGRIAKYLRHAHLKDYAVHHAPNGYRLVRCALGEGVIDFPALFRVFDAQEQPITRTIEMAALNARLIPMLERSWWDEYAPRDARDVLPALSLVWNNLRPESEDWRTPLERDAPPEELAAYEWEQYRASVQYLRSSS